MDTMVSCFTAPAIADIDFDGKLEIIAGGINHLYVWKTNGKLLTNWPVNIMGTPSTPAVGDIDPATAGLEIAVHTSNHWLYVFHADSTLFWRKRCFSGGNFNRMSSPALGDIDGDSLLEIALTGADNLYLLNYDGTPVRNSQGVPVESLFIPMMNNVTRATPIIGDVDGDDECEIIVVSLTQGDIYALEKDGSIAPGYPIMANGLADGTPTLADIDFDGNNELLFTTTTPDVKVWNVLGNKVQWGTYAHDRWHTGLYGFVPYDTTYIGSEELEDIISFKLFQNTPNPFVGTTTISYQLPVSTNVSLSIYDVTGRLVRTLVDKEMSKGSYVIKWDSKNDKGKKVAKGVYFYKLKTNNYQTSKKLIVI
jgi:hypothetical protein